MKNRIAGFLLGALLTLAATVLATNDYFNATGVPAQGAALSSSSMRTEFSSIASGFDKLPTFSGNAGKVAAVNAGATALEARAAITHGTLTATSSGTAINFTGIPSWVNRVTVFMFAVSTSGTSNLLLQIGDSGGIETSGYTATAWSTSGTVSGSASGFQLTGSDIEAGHAVYASITLTRAAAGLTYWHMTGSGVVTGNSPFWVYGGFKSLTGHLDRVRLTTTGGSDTFDAGNMNISYE